MATKQNTASRRSFLATVGVGAAALAVPASAVAASSKMAAEPSSVRKLFAGLDGWYQRELEHLAETNRARFAAGELRGNRDADYPDDDDRAAWATRDLPHDRVERVVGEHFGFVPGTDDQDASLAHLIMAVSPNAEHIAGGTDDVCSDAREAAALDLMAVAIARGMYVRHEGETGPEVLS